MKIVRLEAENLKRLRAVSIEPDGHTVVIAGRNGQGKTSVLDAIWFALGGGQAMKGTSRPIRDGADHASVALDLGDIRVTRIWAGEKTTLRVESADGARHASPQAMLDKLVGRMSFDPLAFAQQDEKTQLATLMELVELPFDPIALDNKRRQIYEDRTDVGREVKTLEGHLAGIPEIVGDVPDHEVSATEILDELRAAQNVIVLREQATRRLEQAEASVTRLRQEFAVAKGEYDTAVQAVADLPTAPDVSSYEQRLATIEETNRQVRAAQERARVSTHLEAKRSVYENYTEALEDLDETKAAAIRDAKMPIDGLAFDATGVTYRGIPFKQASAAEQLRVSLAMAMALNPQIRVVRITDGSLLDSENLRLIEEMAADRDFQVWIERVDETGGVGVLIEDGNVVASNGAPVLLSDAEVMARQEAAHDGFLDNAEPDVAGADDHLADELLS
jgi:DNA repair exonuclease SbcCD ATPase subunit